MRQTYTPKTRLYVPDPLGAESIISLDVKQTHYLKNVMRRAEGDELALFNGQDGEWLAVLEGLGKKGAIARCTSQIREQQSTPDIWVLCAPIKRSRFDMAVEKATELGAGCIWPVFTEHCDSKHIKLDKMRAHTIEAAEQSERLDLPDIKEPVKLKQALVDWPDDRKLIVFAEVGQAKPVQEAFAELSPEQPMAILVGPEGGFSKTEFEYLDNLDFVVKVSLGPRVLRSETALIAGLSCWQAALGDWQQERE